LGFQSETIHERQHDAMERKHSFSGVLANLRRSAGHPACHRRWIIVDRTGVAVDAPDPSLDRECITEVIVIDRCNSSAT
jgi:hypothetical protein